MISKFAFTKIVVADLAAMERFYVDALGLTVTARIDVNEGDWNLAEAILSVAGAGTDATLLNLIHYRDRPAPAPGEAVIGFSVDDLESVIDTALRAGGTLVTAPVAVPEHQLRLAYVGDPEGHLIELLQALG